MSSKFQSVAEFLKELDDQGVTLADWARKHQFPLQSVYCIAKGQSIGKRGTARRVLIAMGVEPPPMFVNGVHVQQAKNAQAA